MPGHPTSASRPIVVASNRGPVSFSRDERGRLVAGRGSGGLVTALTGALQGAGGLWIAAAMTAQDREQAAHGDLLMGPPDARYRVRLLDVDPRTYDRFYNGISNRVLWFAHHRLWDLPRSPRFGPDLERAWSAYRTVNSRFAQELAPLADAGAVLVQDYHLSLVPSMVRERSPSARIAHFSHIPFAGPGGLKVLPPWIREELLTGLLGADVVGFHARDWADGFLMSCRLLAGTRVDLDRRRVQWDGRSVRVGVYPISIDLSALEDEAASALVTRARARLHRMIGSEDLRVILRVDRTDPSKNILRGFLAYEAFLRRHHEWRRRVCYVALLNPSRESVPEYRTYLGECLEAADRINRRFETTGWRPLTVAVRDDFPLALAAYARYDVLVVNPVFDGMNLVAKEGPLLNQRHGVLILSENAGAAAELGRHALVVNPFDVGATAAAIARALAMDPKERGMRAEGLRAAVRANPLERWVGAQLTDLGTPAG
jgi:trehalose 6-phosphate synthase